MKVYALLSYFDERPEHLKRCIGSLAGFCDHLVAVDGPYATFDGTRAYSAAEQFSAIQSAAAFPTDLIDRFCPWPSEVAKRARMFEYGRRAGATPDDWFLIIDGDMSVAEFTPDARAKLAATDRDVAEVRWQDIQIDGVAHTTRRERFMYRALPGLTVERTHFLYTVPCAGCDGEPRADGCPSCKWLGRRFLWRTPDGHLADEPVCDLFGDVTLHHFNSQRDPRRKRRALDYYRERDAATLETAGDWLPGRGS